MYQLTQSVVASASLWTMTVLTSFMCLLISPFDAVVLHATANHWFLLLFQVFDDSCTSYTLPIKSTE